MLAIGQVCHCDRNCRSPEGIHASAHAEAYENPQAAYACTHLAASYATSSQPTASGLPRHADANSYDCAQFYSLVYQRGQLWGRVVG